MGSIANLPVMAKFGARRKSVQARLSHLSALHWQFLSITGVLFGCLAWHIGRGYGWVPGTSRGFKAVTEALDSIMDMGRDEATMSQSIH